MSVPLVLATAVLHGLWDPCHYAQLGEHHRTPVLRAGGYHVLPINSRSKSHAGTVTKNHGGASATTGHHPRIPVGKLPLAWARTHGWP